MKGIFDMTTRLKILPEEKKDPSKIETCSCLDKSAYTRKLFTKKECKEIIEMSKSWEEFEAKVQTKNKEEETVVNDDYRNCSIYAPPVNDQPSWLWIGEKISKAIYSFNSKDGWKFHLLGMAERPMMMKYEQGGPLHAGGKYDWHIDLGPGKVASSRKLGFSLFLNDDYEGGEVQIKTGRENFTPPDQKVGDLLFFPAYLVHRVTLVTKGTRYAIVGWLHGNSFV